MGSIRENPTTPKLPIPGKRNILITSALPYVSNRPNDPNSIGCVLNADVFARFCRLRGYNTIYICGTNEYGAGTEKKAMEENCSPKEFSDKYHAKHKEFYEDLDISFDNFGRTSTPQQTEVYQSIFKKLLDNNWLIENTMEQPYCDACERFLFDGIVYGTCPTKGCNYWNARGDRCENCGKLLNATDLKDPQCLNCWKRPRIRETDTNHLFLDLPALKDKLEEYINNMSVAGSWSQNAIQATQAWLKEELKVLCITRDHKWGVPVPHERFMEKVFYVRFDAPIGYVSITSCYTNDWEKWWKNPENVELYQFMGKDDVPFHTVMFTLLGTGENWTLMKTISVTECLNYNFDGKIYHFRGGKNPVQRYFLLTNSHEASLYRDLRNNLGCFINLVLSFVAKPPGQGYDSIVPDTNGAESHPLTKKLAEKVGKYVEQYVEAMEKVELKQGLKAAMSISSEGLAYLQESKFWNIYEEDQPSCSIVTRTSVGLVHLLSCLLEPFMPSFSVEVFKQLNLRPEDQVCLCDEKGDVDRAKRPWDIIPSGHKIGTPVPLFEELGLFKLILKSGRKQKLKKTAAEPEISIARLDIRVGKITKAQKHPCNDSFYVEEIDVGEGKTRTVVSCLVEYIPLEEMQERMVCVLCNLQPGAMLGIKSQAIVLVAYSSDRTKVELVEPPKSAKIGETITFEGYEGKPDGVLKPKKKVWESVQEDLHTDTELVACYKNVPFTTSAGVCTVSSIKRGPIEFELLESSHN